MKSFPFVILLVLGHLCDKPDKHCKGELGSSVNSDGTVTYFIFVEGAQATMNTVIYQDASGLVTVNNPTLPFSVTIPVVKGDWLTISYDAIVSFPGTIRIELKFSDALGSHKSGTSCSA